MQEHLARQRREVLQELDAAVSAGKYASGIDAAWRLAQEGRGAVLVVEENFHYPARLDVSGLRLTPVSELAGPEVFDDAVDELIETVLGKSGKVVFVEDGALAGHQRLAMILRY
jgi:ribosomal protein L30E